MFHPLVGVLMVLAALAPSVAGRPRLQTVRGKITKIDPARGMLTVLPPRNDAKEVQVEVTGDTRFVSFNSQERKQYTGKAGLKAPEFQVGTMVHAFYTADGKARSVTAFAGSSRPEGAPERPLVHGKVKHIDLKKGVLTLTAKTNGEDKEVAMRFSDDTTFIVVGKEGRKEFTAREAPAAQFQKGTTVTVIKDPKGNVKLVISRPAARSPRPDRK
jgi:hypothetical protein